MLPWHSVLYRESAEVDGDLLEGADLEASCASAEPSVLEGPLAGPVPQNKVELSGPLQNGALEDEAEALLSLPVKVRGGPITINA